MKKKKKIGRGTAFVQVAVSRPERPAPLIEVQEPHADTR